MRYYRVPYVAVLLVSISLFAPAAQAQASFANDGYYALNGTGRSVAPENSASSAVLWGRIANLAGALPGAVIILTHSRQMAVTNADGEFQFVVPATAGPLQAIVTYAGYADETVLLNAAADESRVMLRNTRVVELSSMQKLKRFFKTAHKQPKRDLR